MASPTIGMQDKGLSLQQQRQKAAFWFLAPMVLALFCVAAWPLLRTIWFSFTDTSMDNLYGGKFIGFDNYLRMQTLPSGAVRWKGTLADPAWWNAVWNTVRFAFVSVILEATLGLIVALVMNNDTDIASVARPAFYRQGASGGCGVRLDLASVCTHAWHHADHQIWCCAVALPSRLPV